MNKPTRRVLAVASGGGHWIQLLRLSPAWEGCAVTYVTTTDGFRVQLEAEAKAKADENAIRFGRTKAERLLDAAKQKQARDRLSQLKFDDE